jgi:hypothetical protein
MNKHLNIWSWAILGAMAIAGTASAQYGPPTPRTSVPSGGNQTRFACESVNNQYTVIYRPIDRPNDRYPWAVPSTMGTNWNAAKRCTEIARRLEEYRRDGLKELRTDLKNQYDIVCVTTERNGECRIVFTVPSGRDAIATRDAVFRNLTLADSGQQTTGVTTFAEGNNNGLSGILGKNNLPGIGNINIGGSNPTANRSLQSKDSIDLRPFLSTQDGGTATQLRPSTTSTTDSGVGKLNPDRFRDRK